MADNTRTGLFSLPPELRNQIYELVVFHLATDGVISPIRTKRTRAYYLTDVRTGPDGSREEIDPNEEDPDLNTESTIDSTRDGSASASPTDRDDAIEEPRPVIKLAMRPSNPDGSVNKQALLTTYGRLDDDAHVCTLRCLLQPPLGAVSRRLRQEVLPVFYSVNDFDIYLCNFALFGPILDYTESANKQFLNYHLGLAVDSSIRKPAPVGWWRAIGDTNLRCINHLRLRVRLPGSGSGIGERQWAFEARRLKNHPETSVRFGPEVVEVEEKSYGGVLAGEYPRVGLPPLTACDIFRYKTCWLDGGSEQDLPFLKVAEPSSTSRKEKKARALSTMERSGLCVPAIEMVVAAMELTPGMFLYDHAGLESYMTPNEVRRYREKIKEDIEKAEVVSRALEEFYELRARGFGVVTVLPPEDFDVAGS